MVDQPRAHSSAYEFRGARILTQIHHPSRKGAKIAKAQRRVNCFGRAFASLRSLRLCVNFRLSLSQADVPAVGTCVYFLNNTFERGIDQRRIVDAVVDLHRVMVHLSAALGANQFGFIHGRVPADARDFQFVSENIRASSRAMLRSRSHAAVARRFPYRCRKVA